MKFVPIFFDRRDAGRRLAKRLRTEFGGRDDLSVVALSRGGVPVGQEVSGSLGVDLDVIPAQKIRVPFHPRLAMGALAGDGVRVLNQDVLDSMRITSKQLDHATELSLRQLRWTRELLRGQEPLPIRDRTVILVDDGMVTGATMRAAIRCARRGKAAEIVVASPLGTPEVCEELSGEVERLICIGEVLEMYSIAQAYRSFNAIGDDEMRHALGTLKHARRSA